jgi:hypothetical protein
MSIVALKKQRAMLSRVFVGNFKPASDTAYFHAA